jgi:tRNA(fMet)-specific endonuclease VapC
MNHFIWMLDTNILSDLIRNPTGTAAHRLANYGEDKVCTSITVACELRFGGEKKGAKELSTRIEQLLESMTVLPFGENADRHYARLRAHLEKAGTPIGPNDMLIAAHALAQDLTLVTDNLNEFKRVPELKVENWLDPI